MLALGTCYTQYFVLAPIYRSHLFFILMHSLGEYNKLDQNKLENIYLLSKGWWREIRTKRNRDDGLSKEENGLEWVE